VSNTPGKSERTIPMKFVKPFARNSENRLICKFLLRNVCFKVVFLKDLGFVGKMGKKYEFEEKPEEEIKIRFNGHVERWTHDGHLPTKYCHYEETEEEQNRLKDLNNICVRQWEMGFFIRVPITKALTMAFASKKGKAKVDIIKDLPWEKIDSMTGEEKLWSLDEREQRIQRRFKVTL
jgi:hypothetical protein